MGAGFTGGGNEVAEGVSVVFHLSSNFFPNAIFELFIELLWLRLAGLREEVVAAAAVGDCYGGSCS